MENNQLKKINRDESGLIQGLEYKFTIEGLVDWKAMIPPQFLYVNPDPKKRDKLEKKYNKPYDDIDPIKDNVEDTDLVQLLGAAKYLLKIRGFKSINYSIKEAKEDYAAVSCTIVFNPNYENEMQEIEFSENACAHFQNTSPFIRGYLVEMATNRAFVRCVRNFLSINIVNKEELSSNIPLEEDNNKSVQDLSKWYDTLENLMKEKKVTWDNIVMKLKSENKFNEEWKKITDISKDILFEYIERLKKAKLGE